jgi:hypothetical protein
MVTQTKESFDTDMISCGEEDSPAAGGRCIPAFTSEEVEKKFKMDPFDRYINE